MTWIYDVVPIWAVYAVAAWFALLALWVGVRLARALHAEAFRAFDLDAPDDVPDDWPAYRAGRIREWQETAVKGFSREPAHRWTNKDGKDAA